MEHGLPCNLLDARPHVSIVLNAAVEVLRLVQKVTGCNTRKRQKIVAQISP